MILLKVLWIVGVVVAGIAVIVALYSVMRLGRTTPCTRDGGSKETRFRVGTRPLTIPVIARFFYVLTLSAGGKSLHGAVF